MRVTMDGLEVLRHLQGLSDLSLRGCSQLPDALCYPVAHLHALTRLDLRNCERFTGVCLHLMQPSAICDVHTSFCGAIPCKTTAQGDEITNRVNVSTLVSGQARLRSLCSARCDCLSCHFDWWEWQKIHSASQTAILAADAPESPPGAAGPEVRLGPHGLTVFAAGAGENIREWRSLRSLQELNLKGCYKIEDAGLQGLSLMTSLTSLNLQECWQITAEGLGAISGNPLV